MSNENDTLEHSDDEVTGEQFSPGAALSEAREQSGVSLETIANKTAIPIAKLKLLESDEFDQLGAELFVIGYLKKYAAILNLPETELISDYRSYRSESSGTSDSTAEETLDKSLLSAHSPSSSTSSLNIEIRDSSFSNREMFYSDSSSTPLLKRVWFWALVILLLLAWGAYEMFFGERAIINSSATNSVILSPLSNSGDSETNEDVTLDTIEINDVISEKVNSTLEVLPEEISLVSDPASGAVVAIDSGVINSNSVTTPNVGLEDIVDLSSVSDSSTDLGMSSKNTTLSANVSDEVEAEINVALEVSQDLEDIETISQTVSEQEKVIQTNETTIAGNDQSVNEPINSELDRLDIDFNDDCWLEVKDASGVVSIAKLQRGGDKLRLFGKAPFSVKLGNGRAAQLHINGRLFDIPLFGSRKTTKFNVTKISEIEL